MFKDYKETGLFLKAIGKNSASLFCVNILPAISSFIIGVLVSRRLGVAPYGEYVTAYNFYNMFYFLPLLGLGAFVIRDLAIDQARVNKYITNIGLISIVTSALCFFLICFTASLMHYGLTTKTSIYIVSLSLFPNSLILLAQALFIAIGRIRYAFFAAIAETLIKLLLSAWVLAGGGGVAALMSVQVLSKLAGMALSIFFVIVSVKTFRPEIDFAFCKKVWRQVAFAFALITMLNNIFTKTDILVLSGIRGMREVGLYSPASKLVWFGYLFIYALTTALLPIISRLSASSPGMLEEGGRRLFKYLILLLAPFLLAGFLFSGRLVLFFFGNEFSASVPVLQTIIWSVFFFGIFSLCDAILIASDKQTQIVYTLGFSLAAGFMLNTFFSYRLGYAGTSIALLFSTGIFAVLEIFLVSRFLDLRLVAALGRPLLGLAAAGLCIYLAQGRLNISLLLPLSLAAYFSVLFILGTFTQKDARFFKRLWQEGLICPAGS